MPLFGTTTSRGNTQCFCKYREERTLESVVEQRNCKRQREMISREMIFWYGGIFFWHFRQSVNLAWTWCKRAMLYRASLFLSFFVTDRFFMSPFWHKLSYAIVFYVRPRTRSLLITCIECAMSLFELAATIFREQFRNQWFESMNNTRGRNNTGKEPTKLHCRMKSWNWSRRLRAFPHSSSLFRWK